MNRVERELAGMHLAMLTVAVGFATLQAVERAWDETSLDLLEPAFVDAHETIALGLGRAADARAGIYPPAPPDGTSWEKWCAELEALVRASALIQRVPPESN